MPGTVAPAASLPCRRLDILRAGGGLDKVIASSARYSERCWVEAEGKGLLPRDKVYGPVLVFHRLWEQLGLAHEIGEHQGKTGVEFPIEEAAFAMVLNRLLDPRSKRATYRWLETVYRPKFEALELQHLSWALDHLIRGKERIEEALFARNRDLFSLAVDLAGVTAKATGNS